MRHQLTRISVIQTSKVAAAIYFVLGCLYGLIIAFLTLISEEGGMLLAGMFFIFMPIFMGVVGFIGFAVVCWLYNVIAKSVGGIEFILEEVNAKGSPES